MRQLQRFNRDFEQVVQPRRAHEIEQRPPHHENQTLLARQFILIQAETAQPLRAGALEEVQIVAMEHDAARIRVLVVHAQRQTEGGRRRRPGAGNSMRTGLTNWRAHSTDRPIAARCRCGQAEMAIGRQRGDAPARRALQIALLIRNGSSTSSIVSRSSPMAAARLSSPTGPPPNFSSTASSSLRSITSKPMTSTSSMRSAEIRDLARHAAPALSPPRSRARVAAAGSRCAAFRASASRFRRRLRARS